MNLRPVTGAALELAEAEADLCEAEAETELAEECCDCVDAVTVLDMTVSISTRSKGSTSSRRLSEDKVCNIE